MVTKIANTPATAKAQWNVFECMNCGGRIGYRQPNVLLGVNGDPSLPAI
jgi:hypothetical protein